MSIIGYAATITSYGPKFALPVICIVLFASNSRKPWFILWTIAQFLVMTAAFVILIWGSAYQLEHNPNFSLWNSELWPVKLSQPGPAPGPQFISRSNPSYVAILLTATAVIITLPGATLSGFRLFSPFNTSGWRFFVYKILIPGILAVLYFGELLAGVIVAFTSVTGPPALPLTSETYVCFREI